MPNIVQAHLDLLHHRLLARLPWPIVQAHADQGKEHGDEAQAVQSETPRGAQPGKHNAADRRTYDAGQVEHGRVQRDRILKITAVIHHLNGQRQASRRIEGVRDATQERQHGDVPDLQCPGTRQRGQDESKEHHAGLRNEHELPSRNAVGHDSGRERQKQHGDRPGEGDSPQRQFGAGQLVYKPTLRHHLHPGAYQGQSLADEPAAVVAVSQRCKRGGQAADRRERPLGQVETPSDDGHIQPIRTRVA